MESLACTHLPLKSLTICSRPHSKEQMNIANFKMENFRSFIEQSIHTRLQDATRFQIPIPLFVAFIVLSSLHIIGRSRLTSAVALASTVRDALRKSSTLESVPLLFSLFNTFNCALNTACLRVRIYVKTPIQWRHLFNPAHRKPRHDDTYATPRAEAKYWRDADRYRRRLYSDTGTTLTALDPFPPSRDAADIPLVTYYTPRLLPPYRRHSTEKRTSREANVEARDGWISPKMFCKWHRMVFQDSCHPTLTQAAVQMKYYSHRDLREIQRIARLLPDEQVFGPKWQGARKTKRFAKYSGMWGNWLEAKGVGLVIVFE